MARPWTDSTNLRPAVMAVLMKLIIVDVRSVLELRRQQKALGVFAEGWRHGLNRNLLSTTARENGTPVGVQVQHIQTQFAMWASLTIGFHSTCDAQHAQLDAAVPW